MMGYRVLGVIACLIGCGDDGDAPRAHTATEPTKTAQRQREEPEVTIEPAPEGGAVVTHRGAAGGTVRIAEGSQAAVAGMAPFQVILSLGRAHAVMPPAGNVERPTLRIATPSGTIEIAGSGEVWVEVARDGRAWAATLSGFATAASGAVGDDGGPVETPVPAGRAALLARGEVDVRVGPERLDDAQRVAREALSGAGDPVEDAHAEATGDLVETLAVVEEQARAGEALASAQRSADPAEARRIQRDIVAHAQRMLRLRRGLLVRWERARATAGDGDDDPGSRRAIAVARALGIEAPAPSRAVP